MTARWGSIFQVSAKDFMFGTVSRQSLNCDKLVLFSHKSTAQPLVCSSSRHLHIKMHLRLANASDLPDITTCFIAAFEPDPVATYLHPYRHDYPESYRAWSLNDRKQQYLAPASVVMVAETDPEDLGADGRKQIVGSAFWRRWGVEKVALQRQKKTNDYARSMY